MKKQQLLCRGYFEPKVPLFFSISQLILETVSEVQVQYYLHFRDEEHCSWEEVKSLGQGQVIKAELALEAKSIHH